MLRSVWLWMLTFRVNMIERKIWLFVCSVLWVQVSSNPQNCNSISRSSVVYKYPYQQTKTILYQLPYHQSVTSSTTKQPQVVYDSNHASTLQPVQQPLLQHNPISSSEYSQDQNKEQKIEYRHAPTLNNINQQYQTLPLPQFKGHEFNFNQGYLNFLPSSSTPQQYFAPQQSQYVYTSLPSRAGSTHRPIINPYQLPQIVPLKHFNKILHQPTNQVPQNFHIYSPHVKATPLVFSQVYHPIYPQTHNLLKTPPLLQQHIPQLQQPVPNYYTNFHPMMPAPVQAQHNDASPQKDEEREEEKEEVNEEDHENNEEEPDADDASYKKDYNFDENFFKNSKYTFPQFSNEEEEDEGEKGSYKVQDHEDQEEDSDDHEESVNSYVLTKPYSKVTSKYKPEKYHSKAYKRFKPSKEVNKPKTEVKMFHYTKSLNIPPKEFIESKGSESVPVIQKSKQTFRENWYITKSTREQ